MRPIDYKREVHGIVFELAAGKLTEKQNLLFELAPLAVDIIALHQLTIRKNDRRCRRGVAFPPIARLEQLMLKLLLAVGIKRHRPAARRLA